MINDPGDDYALMHHHLLGVMGYPPSGFDCTILLADSSVFIMRSAI
jgi:hypothetical protein